MLNWRIGLIMLVAGGSTVDGHSLKSAQATDPYQLSFSDFEWDEGVDLKPLQGSQKLGEAMPLEKSIAMFEARLAAAPADIGNYLVLGDLYLQLAKEKDELPAYGKSVDILRSALKLSPESYSAQLYLAQSLLAQHEFHEALALAETALKTSPTSLLGKATRFDALLELGEYARAKAVLAELSEAMDAPPIWARSARIEELHGNSAKAIELVERCVEHTPDSSWFRWRLGGLLFDRGELELAKLQFAKGLDIELESGPCLVGVAKCEFALGNREAAKKILSKAVELYGEPPMMSLMGDLCAASGEAEQAADWYQRTEAAMREEAKIAGDAHAREFAMFLADHDRSLDEALKLAEGDLRRRRDAYAYDTLAWAQFKSGDLPSAVASISKSLEPGGQDPMLYYHAALIFSDAKQSDNAARYWKMLQSSNPKFSILSLHSIPTSYTPAPSP